jgi:hypothetical protein
VTLRSKCYAIGYWGTNDDGSSGEFVIDCIYESENEAKAAARMSSRPLGMYEVEEYPFVAAPAAPSNEVTEIFAHYLAAFPRKRQTKADEGQRKVIRKALEVADADEIKRCIDLCAASEWHQKEGIYKNRAGGKHDALSLILAPKTRGSNYPSGRSQREQIDFWLGRDDTPTGPTQAERDEWNLAIAHFQNGDGPDPGPAPWRK